MAEVIVWKHLNAQSINKGIDTQNTFSAQK